MRIDLTPEPSDNVLQVFISGKLADEIAVGQCTTHANLLREVELARRLERLLLVVAGLVDAIRAAPRIAQDGTPDTKAAGLMLGLLDGLDGKTVPHPSPGVPPVLRDNSPAYRAGWEYGEMIRNHLWVIDRIRKGDE